MHDDPKNPADLIARVARKYDGADDEAARLKADALARLEWRKRRGRKQCDRCGEAKPVSAFSRDSTRADGLLRRCKSCDADLYKARVNARSTTD